MHKFAFYFSMGVIFMATLLILAWFIPPVIVKRPYDIRPGTLEQGATFDLVSDYCKILPLAAKFQIAFVGIRESDGLLIRYPVPGIFPSDAPVGCAVGNFSLQVPEDLAPGIFHVELSADFAFWPRIYTWKSIEFPVVAGKSVEAQILEIIEQWGLDEWRVVAE